MSDRLVIIAGAILAALAIVPSLYRRWRDGRTIARLRADRDVQAGRADVAEAQAAVVTEVAAARVDGERAETAVAAVAATAEAAGDPHPERAAARERVRLVDARRAADRVRAAIARRR